MSRKNTVLFPVATAQSLSASFNSAPTMVQYLDNVSYQINITTSNSTGSFAVQASLDYQPASNAELKPVNAGTWTSLTLSGTPTVGAANDTIIIDLNQLPFKAIRLAYTAGTAGTGVCDINLVAKQLGG